MKSEAEVLKEYTQALKAGLDSLSAWRQDAIEDFQMYASNQWSRDDINALEGQDRPAVVFNKITGIINAVAGSEITNRFETRFLPRTQDDEFFNETMTEVVRFIRQRSDVEHEESGAFMDAAICGVGATHFWKDYSEDPEGIDRVDRVDIFDLLWDPSARKMNLDDRRWHLRGRWIPIEEAKTRWPEKADQLTSLASATDGAAYPQKADGEVHDQTNAFKYENNDLSYYTPESQKVLVHEYERWYLAEKVFFQVGDHIPMEQSEGMVDPEQWTIMEQTFMDAGLVEGQDYGSSPIQSKEYYRGYFTGNIMLSDELSDIQDGFKYKFITGFREQREDKVVWFGLVKLMKDPQKWLNKSMSQIIYIMSTNPKGALLAEKGVFLNPEQRIEDWAKPNSIIEVRPGAISERQFMIAKSDYPAGIERIMEISGNFVSEAVAVNPYFMGTVDDLKRTAGSAVTSVQQQALMVLSVLFDSLRRYRKAAGRMHLAFIREFMPDGVIIRIAIPEMGGVQQPMPFKKDWIDKVKYDVVVDEAPSSPNAIREFWNSLQQTQSLELLMNAGIMTPDIIADTVPDVPTTIRERMKMNAMKQDVVNQVLQMISQGDMQGATEAMLQFAEEMGALPPGGGEGPPQ